MGFVTFNDKVSAWITDYEEKKKKEERKLKK